jgi:DJ-1 family protein
MDIRVLVPIAHGTEEIEAVVIVDLLRRAGINVKIAGEFEIITCSRGVKILSDVLLRKLKPEDLFDAIVIPGGSAGTQVLSENEKLQEMLEEHRDNGKLIAAICAAPTILAQHRIIPVGSSITSHPSVMKSFAKYNYLEDAVVMDGNFITSRGAGTAIEFTLKIIETLIDSQTAENVAKAIVYR